MFLTLFVLIFQNQSKNHVSNKEKTTGHRGCKIGILSRQIGLKEEGSWNELINGPWFCFSAVKAVLYNIVHKHCDNLRFYKKRGDLSIWVFECLIPQFTGFNVASWFVVNYLMHNQNLV